MNELTESLSDYDHLSKEEWNDLIEHHVQQIDRIVNHSIRRALQEYVVTVFAGAWGTELKFVGDVLDSFRDQYARQDLATQLDRRNLFRPALKK